MSRKTGYLANISFKPSLPPLIFRFQFNPDLLSEKKSYKYDANDAFGAWGFANTKAATGLVSGALGLLDDIKANGPAIIATKPLTATEGDQRVFSIDFALDASVPGPMDGDDHYGGSIEPDLAVLRSFMVPTWDVLQLQKFLMTKQTPPWKDIKPSECALFYGGLSVTCVMTDLNIKITAFQDDGTARRADVSVTLKEQSRSYTPITELITRNINVAKSFNRKGIGSDILATTPIVNLFT